MKHFFLSLLLFSFFLVSCNKEKCVTCTNGQFSEEFCEDGDIDYTDSSGNPVEGYDVIIDFLENAGYTCN